MRCLPGVKVEARVVAGVVVKGPGRQADPVGIAVLVDAAPRPSTPFKPTRSLDEKAHWACAKARYSDLPGSSSTWMPQSFTSVSSASRSVASSSAARSRPRHPKHHSPARLWVTTLKIRKQQQD